MRLKVLLPSKILIDQDVEKVVAEAQNGSFCLLPRHIDFITALVPGILCFTDMDGREEFIAVDEGILNKTASIVIVSTRNAVLGHNLGKLHQAIRNQYMEHEEHEKIAQAALARLEADLVRRFIEFGQSKHV